MRVSAGTTRPPRPLGGTQTLVFRAPPVLPPFMPLVAIHFDAYYAHNLADVTTVAWHRLGSVRPDANGVGQLTLDTRTIPDQGNAGWGTVNILGQADYAGNAHGPAE